MKDKNKSLYSNMQRYNKYNFLSAYLSFVSSNVFHVFFNALITVLILEVFVFYSGICSSNEIIPLENFITYVLILPICIVVIVAIIYTILFFWFSMNRINYFLNKIEIISNKDKLNNYQEIIVKKYYKYILVFDILGALFYTLSGYIASIILINNESIQKYINNGNIFILCITIAGFVFGVVWNFASYYEMKRIDWSKLLISINKNNSRKNSFYCMIKQIIWEIIALFIVLFLFLYSFFNFTNTQIINDDLLTYLSIILGIISALIFTYIKLIYKFEFSKKSNNIIYPIIKDIIE